MLMVVGVVVTVVAAFAAVEVPLLCIRRRLKPGRLLIGFSVDRFWLVMVVGYW